MDSKLFLVLCLYTAATAGWRVVGAFLHQEQEAMGVSKSPTNGQYRRDSTLPNIVFVMADDLGYGDVGYNGGNAETPHLDAMAAGPNTVHLTRYYSGGPVCSPTRGTVLTGRNHNRYCVWTANIGKGTADFVIPETMPLPPTEITVTEILKKHGYQTAMFGKWHLGDFKKLPGGNKKWPVSHPGMHGFDEWWATERSAQSTNINCACFNDTKQCVLGHYNEAPTCTNYYTIKDSPNRMEALDYPINGDDSQFLASELERYLEQAMKSDKPFFVYLPLHTVHIRYIATEGYIERYVAKNFTLDEIDYYGAITAMDDAVGQVRDTLKKFGLNSNTMLWFTSDNGPAKGTPGVTAGYRGRKAELFEGGIRLPGLIEWPDVIKSNKKSDYPVVSSDLLPTVCDILGVSPPSDRPIDGASILPFLKGEKSKRNASIKWAFNIRGNFKNEYQAAISDDQYKVYATYKDNKIVPVNTYLFDLLNDPFETKDLAHEKTDLFKSMKTDLENWRQNVIKSAKDKVKCYEE